MMTAFVSEEIKEKAFDMGADNFVVKPFDIVMLYDIVLGLK